MHDPMVRPLEAVERVLQYLNAILERGLLFKGGVSLIMEAYTYTNYAGSMIDKRSIFGYCTFLCRNLVTWRSMKQNVLAYLSTKGEFRVMVQGICELLWIEIVLEVLKINMKLFCNNKLVGIIAYNPVLHDRTKRIEKEKLDVD